MNGMNASVPAGWYTFSNRGPITTTFTPAPSCSGSDMIGIGNLNPTANYLAVHYNVQCTSQISYFSDCMPTVTPASTSTPPAFTGTSSEEYDEYLESEIEWEGYDAYYSPGLYCPAGWETIGMAARDASSSLISSGILVPTTTPTATRFKTGDSWYYKHEENASVLKSILEPRQTMALCCPSGMTADSGGACYSFLEDYTPTFGCEVYTGYNYEYGESTYTYSDFSKGVTSVGVYNAPTATISKISTYTTILGPVDQDYYTGIQYAPVITLLHHESDLQAATGTPSTAANDNSSSSSSETPSNAAGRLGTRASVWDGLGSVIGIWVGAAVLGAAMILPW